MTPLPDPLPKGAREMFVGFVLEETTPPLRGTPPSEWNFFKLLPFKGSCPKD